MRADWCFSLVCLFALSCLVKTLEHIRHEGMLKFVAQAIYLLPVYRFNRMKRRTQQAFSVGLTLHYRWGYGCGTVSVWLDMKVFLTTIFASGLTLKCNTGGTPYLYIVSLSESDLTLTKVPSLDCWLLSCGIKNVEVTPDYNVAQSLSGGWK